MEGTSPNSTFVGIDVSKDRLDVATLPQSKGWHVPNTSVGISRLVDQLQGLGRCLIVIEASGGWERRVVGELLEAGHAVARVNPRRVRDFARALGHLAKTDRLDAQVLAQFAAQVQPRPLEKAHEKQAELTELVTRRRQLIGMKVAETNRMQQSSAKAARKSVKHLLKSLENEIHDIDKAIAQLIEDDDDWSQRQTLLESIPGLGKVVSCTLVAHVPELGKLNRQAISSLIGLAPFTRESGSWEGKRSIRGGRGRVRSVLYMAALTAYRCNPTIRSFAQRLLDKGKPFKVMITACMRKLLVIINTMIRENQAWNQHRLVNVSQSHLTP